MLTYSMLKFELGPWLKRCMWRWAHVVLYKHAMLVDVVVCLLLASLVKLLCLLLVLLVWLGVDPNLSEMPRVRLCCNVLGDDGGRGRHRVDLEDSHEVVERQFLDKGM